MLAVMALLLNTGSAFAQGASSDWNDSWGFPTPFEKSNLLEQALAIELVENDGFTQQNTFYDHTSIGTLIYDNSIGKNGVIAIDNSINDSIIDSFNTKDSYNKTTTTTTTTTNNKNIDVDVNADGSFNAKKFLKLQGEK
jgi:hypothetical protein